MANGLTYKRVTTTPLATKQLAATLAAHLRPNDVVVLIGDLGAGKTQFVQGIADGLGIKDQVTSPTFNIQVTYDGGRLPLHHFDLYRLEQEEELDDIGFYDTIESDGRVVFAHAYGDSSRQLLFLWANDSKSRLVKTVK